MACAEECVEWVTQILEEEHFQKGVLSKEAADNLTILNLVSKSSQYMVERNIRAALFKDLLFPIWAAYQKVLFTHHASFAQRLKEKLNMSPHEFHANQSNMNAREIHIKNEIYICLE